jgi:hypothetical protein
MFGQHCHYRLNGELGKEEMREGSPSLVSRPRRWELTGGG